MRVLRALGEVNFTWFLAAHFHGSIALGRQERLWLLCWEARLTPPGSCRSAWYFKSLCILCCCTLPWLTWVTSWELLWTSQCGRVFPAEVPKRSGLLRVHLGTNHSGFPIFPAHLSGCRLLLPACNQNLVTGCAGLGW